MQSPPQRNQPFAHPLVFSLSAGLLGCGLNRFGFPILGDTEFLFGSCASLLTAYLFGPKWGAFAALLAGSLGAWETSQAGALVIHVVEAALIGWLVQHRQMDYTRATLCYWLVAGLPLALIDQFGLVRAPFPLNWAQTIAYPANGLLAAAMVMPLASSDHFRRWIGLPSAADTAAPLLHIFFRRFGVLTALPIALLSLVAGQSFDRTLLGQTRDKLGHETTQLGQMLQEYILEHQRDLVALAKNLSAHPHSPEETSRALATMREQYPGFLTLLVAATSGKIVAAAPAMTAAGEPIATAGLSVADRDYFIQVMTHGKPYLSGVFRGRGFGQDLIVAMSAPIVDDNHHTVAVVEGSLNLAHLLQLLQNDRRVEQREVILLDASNHVVTTAGRRLLLPPLSNFASHPLSLASRHNQPVAAYDLEQQDGHGTERHLVSTHELGKVGWRLFMLEPIWRTQRMIVHFYVVTALWAALALIVAILLARITATEITEPLTHLVQLTHAIAQKRPAPPPPARLVISREMAQISTDLQQAATTLSRSNSELNAAMRERDRTHHMLRQVLMHLDEKVRERTLQLDEARQAAESANRAKSEFLASMSHELRTPLNVILGMSEIIREQTLGPLNPRQTECIVSVEESGRHLLSLINDILDLSKIEAGMFQLDLGEPHVRDTCEASLRFVHLNARKKNIQLRTEYLHTTDSVVADPRRLKQILVNLLSNAVKFTPDEGTITLRVEQTANPPCLHFHVEDSGIGIEPANIGRLFQPFQQIDTALNRKFAGTGLGLALVRRMTELHGGTVQVTSEPGHGSRFTIHLPLHAAPGPAPSPAEPLLTRRDTIPPIPGHPRILIAEDNETNIRLYTQNTAFAQCQFTLAHNGRDAVALARAELPDLILMDVQMPEMDGLEATRLLRADPLTAHIPIITLTALARPEDRLRCLEAGASAYLSKPVRLAELTRQVAELLPGRPPNLPPP